MNLKQSHYEVLGAFYDATSNEIHAAYKKLASKLHPDKGGSSEQMQQLNAAYSVLKDATRRHAYDRTLSHSKMIITLAEAARGFVQFEDQIFELPQGFYNKCKIVKSNIVIQIIFKEDPRICAFKGNWYIDQQVSTVDALIGGLTVVDWFGQKIPVQIPTGTQTGDTVELLPFGPKLTKSKESKVFIFVKLYTPVLTNALQEHIINILLNKLQGVANV